MAAQSALPRSPLICFAFCFAVVAAGLIGCTSPPPADLILTNGRIMTMESDQPEVQALAVRQGLIVALGDNGTILRREGPETRVLDLEGQFATPGWIESHAHFSGIGEAAMNLRLGQCRTWQEVVDMVADAVRTRPAGTWITGRGWHQEKWTSLPEPSVEGMPVHDLLSRVSPDHPVLLDHASGHAAFANAKAMELARVDRDTPDPAGGTIVRDPSGRPTGVFRETASGLIERARAHDLAGLTEEERRQQRVRRLELAVKELVSHGITSIHDAGASFDDVRFYRQAAESGQLPVRLYVMLGEPNDRLAVGAAEHRVIGAAGNRVTVRAVKRYADGALGSHGAWLKEPYADLPVTGLATESLESLTETARIAVQQDLQLCIHAIGDRANAEVLGLYERMADSPDEAKARRWRIEHAQHIDPADIPAFARLGVIAAMQAIHAVSDGPWVPLRIGEQRAREGAYIWRSLLDAGVVICNGSDAPVEPVDPLASFHASVTRQMPDGRAFYPEQAMSREEALRSYTTAGAFAAFEEDIKGSLAVGKLADITVLSEDLRSVATDRIRGTKVVYTIIGGEVVYAAENH